MRQLPTAATNPVERRRYPPVFSNPPVVAQAWYVAAQSRKVTNSTVHVVPMLNRQIALYRDHHGRAHAIDARCAHLGTNLRHGRVVGETVQCAFHGWRWGAAGHCHSAPGFAVAPTRRIRVYPTVECWGMVWVFNGAQPSYDLPDLPQSKRWRSVRLPPQTIRCHPHLVIANGLDAAHFAALHGMVYTAPVAMQRDQPNQVTLMLTGRPRSRLLQRLTGSVKQPICANFTTVGCSIAMVSIEAPVAFHVLFSGRSTSEGDCVCVMQTVLFLPSFGMAKAQAITLLLFLLRDDARILNDIRFVPGFSEHDQALSAFAELVNKTAIG